jgi:hypothetical protein
MDDYVMCEMCQQVTVEVMKSPTGFQHYTDLKLVRIYATSPNECRLCSLIWKAIYQEPNELEIDDSLKPDAVSCAVRLSLESMSKFNENIDELPDGEKPVAVVVTCRKGGFVEGDWRNWYGLEVMRTHIEVCDQLGRINCFM